MTEKTLTGKYIIATYAHSLAAKRQRSIDLSDQIALAEEALKKLPEAQTFDKLHDDLVANLADEKEIEGMLRASALEVAIDLEIKDPAPGITVSKKTTFTIDEETLALAACRATYPQLIKEKIDKVGLKKIVVALGIPINGTTLNIEEYGQVKIASDLSEHYPSEKTPF